MARSTRLIASAKRTSTTRANKSEGTSPIASSNASTTPTGNPVGQSQVPVNSILQTTPSFIVGQRVSVQLRTYIWIPGTVIGFAFSQQYSSYVYDIQFYAADGSRSCSRFFSRDVRSE
ncbi:hypothetical protein K466DRAFT_595024 [Polyporus arcularius HHB13444]|uniref:Uncharacterized protein n=2 Tax=Polyporaceae TaxID=5317 RepID=A0A5C3PS88_9APHY|nr:hypothetical protein OH76DRAFT_1395065 [Polyporus brumalis]TFK92645.1 hypothetical protein K466DRAFT_595024 [Polyporus arcularius HHB13444]